MGLYKGNKPVVQLLGCHDQPTANGEFVLKRPAIGYVVYLIQKGVSLKRGHYIKGNHLLSKHAFIKIVNTTRVHRRTSSCFKVYIAECVTLICQSPNKIKVRFT